MKGFQFAMATALVLSSTFGSLAIAQEKISLDGRWLAEYPRRNNATMLEAVVVLKGSSGTWNVTPPSVRARNPCLGRDYPIAVIAESAESVDLAVRGSQALTGCSDLSVKLKRIDDKTLEGLIDDTRKVTLKRQ